MRLAALIALSFLFFYSQPASSDGLYRGMGINAFGATNDDLADIASTGANAIRVLYFNPEADNQSAAEYRAWMDAVIADLDRMLGLLSANGLKGVFVIVAPPGGRDESGRKPYDRIFTTAKNWAQDLFVESWERMALELNGDPNVAAYHIMSEPAAPNGAMWKALAQRLVDAIRGAGSVPAEQQPIIMLSSLYGNISLVRSIPKPTNPGRYAATANLYHPYDYTHQGVYNDKVMSYPRCREVNPDTGKAKRLRGKKARKKARTCSYRGIVKRARMFAKYAKRKKVDAVIGEFSVAGWAPNAARYLSDVHKFFERKGFSAFYHSYGEYPGWDINYDGTRRSWKPATSKTDRRLELERFFQLNSR